MSIFDALLHVLVIEVELVDAVVGAVTGVVAVHNGFEGLLLFFGVFLVI